ncbi:hypothetical protein DFJ58DRAFT_843674 [Suillus subalutaceus]|uniref:uncharacterized protein n=1 Tax=Suillus subalutaceus TaxID=48586 RepID=UPI001B87F1C0|nr:uncharacterized protein DFJ58DRAFT_843674 [Suillus subalutaceus]KAG1845687.1 hypothetical protein DFJ58DRAFT_843674 [Suillus subalutaceus]
MHWAPVIWTMYTMASRVSGTSYIRSSMNSAVSEEEIIQIQNRQAELHLHMRYKRAAINDQQMTIGMIIGHQNEFSTHEMTDGMIFIFYRTLFPLKWVSGTNVDVGLWKKTARARRSDGVLMSMGLESDDAKELASVLWEIVGNVRETLSYSKTVIRGKPSSFVVPQFEKLSTNVKSA